ncbi:regulator of G-protein signaling 20 [Cherax quadricarinatus]
MFPDLCLLSQQMSSAKAGFRMAKLRREASGAAGGYEDAQKKEAGEENSVRKVNSGGAAAGSNATSGGGGESPLGVALPVAPAGEMVVRGAPTGTANTTTTTTTSTAAASINQQRQRRCCFFWCCCCRCSCLNVKTPEDHRHKIGRIDLLNGDNEPPPTIEEIRAWSDSFERLMKCSSGRQAFRDFLKCEYSEENILFWQACEDLKVENNPSVIEEKARLIYEDYISILSPKEVSLDSRVREIINRNMVDPTPHTFDEAQTQIYTLMHRDSYPRFINSAIYKRLAQLNNNGSSGSSRKESAT